MDNHNKLIKERQKTRNADASDHEMVSFERKQKNLAFKERGSKKFPDGKPIPGNENLDSKVR